MTELIAELTNLANGSACAGDPLAAEICRKAILAIERLQTIVKAHEWRDATQVNPADGDEFLVAVKISDDQVEWWEYEIVTVQKGEHYFGLEVNGGSWDCRWAEVAWCIPMSAMQPPEAKEAKGEKL